MTDDERLDALRRWRDAAPPRDLPGFDRLAAPALATARRAIPASAARRAMTLSYRAGLRLARPAALLARHRDGPLALAACEALALREGKQALLLAGGAGTAFGLVGALGLVADAPALLVLALRSLIRIGACYGEAPTPALAAAIFALASADTVQEKHAAWNAALATQPASDAALRDGLERAVEREFARQALQGSAQKLAASLVSRLGWRKAAGALPLIGAAVGGAVNAQFVARITEAARWACTARRLQAQGLDLRLDELPPLPATRVMA